jgi:phosphatidylserine/phosphatidylglycerophosphate/cardiolipin synthase-like enzyme
MVIVTGRVVDEKGTQLPDGLIAEAIGEWLLTSEQLAKTETKNGRFRLEVPEILDFDELPRPFKFRITDVTKRPLTKDRELNGTDKNQELGDIVVQRIEVEGLLVTNGTGTTPFVSSENAVTLLIDGVEAFGRVADDIKKAQNSINITQLFFSLPEKFNSQPEKEEPALIFNFDPPDLVTVDPVLKNQPTPVPRGKIPPTINDDRPELLLMEAALKGRIIRLLLNEPGLGFPEGIFLLGVLTPLAAGLGVGGVAAVLLWMGIGIPFFPVVLAVTVIAFFAEFIKVNLILADNTHVDEARTYFGSALAAAKPKTAKFLVQGFRQALPDHGVFHCKMMITDQSRAVIVGSPFKQRYYDSQLHSIEDAHRGINSSDAIHDLSVAVEGPAVTDLHEAFRLFWNEGSDEAGKVQEAITKASAPSGISPTYKVQVVRTINGTRFKQLNDKSEKGILEGYLRAFAAAKHYIYLENQYFTDSVITDALVEVLKKNKDLELILVVPIKPDVSFYPRRQAHRIDQIREAGGERVGVFTRWTYDEKHFRPWIAPVYIHAKGAVIDDSWATIGSANLDGLSLDYNLLLSPLVFGETTATELNINVLPPTPDAVTPFAVEMRRRLWAEHLGLIDSGGNLDPNHKDLQPDRTFKWVEKLWRPSAAAALQHVQAGKKEPLHGFVLEYPKEDGGCLDTPRKHLAALGVKLNMNEAVVRPVTGTRKFHFDQGKWDKSLEREDFEGAKP